MINLKRTELMRINTTVQTPVTVNGEPIREVESFIYLGSVMDIKGGTERDMMSRIEGCMYHAEEHLGLREHPHYYQTADTQFQCEVSPTCTIYIWSTAMSNDENTTPEDLDILQHLSQEHFQHPMT